MEPIKGTMVTPNVQLTRLLGEGGMGSVWVAEHLTLKTEVAVKFVDPQLINNDPAIITRFQREASAAAKIKSPHVIRTFDHGLMDDGTPYIVMELLEGESLRERLERTEVLTARETALLIQQVARALSNAHELGIVHRDIKPDNLFFIDAGRLSSDGDPAVDELFVKVLDFGIAKNTQLHERAPMTQTGAMIGTPLYMSPEQVRGSKDVDFRSDLWALSVVAYQCLTGEVPFKGETIGGVCIAVARGRFTAPSKLRTDVPKRLDEWFKVALCRDKSGRFGSGKAMVEAFERALGGEARLPSRGKTTPGTSAPPKPASSGIPVTLANETDVRKLMQRLPLPLAQLVRKIINTDEPLQRHRVAYQLAEATLKLATTVRIGLWFERDGQSSSEVASRLAKLNHPTISHWVQLLEPLSTALAQLADPGDVALGHSHNQLIARVDQSSAIRRFVQRLLAWSVISEQVASQALTKGLLGFFDLVASYGETVVASTPSDRTKFFYEEMGTLLMEATVEALAERGLFGDHRLALSRRRPGSEGATQSASWEELVGLAGMPMTAIGDKARRLDFEPGQLYFVGSTSCIPLYPFLVYREDDSGLQQIGFLNLRVGKATTGTLVQYGQLEYLNYVSGRSLSEFVPQEALAELLPRRAESGVGIDNESGLVLASTPQSSSPETDATLPSMPTGPEPEEETSRAEQRSTGVAPRSEDSIASSPTGTSSTPVETANADKPRAVSAPVGEPRVAATVARPLLPRWAIMGIAIFAVGLTAVLVLFNRASNSAIATPPRPDVNAPDGVTASAAQPGLRTTSTLSRGAGDRSAAAVTPSMNPSVDAASTSVSGDEKLPSRNATDGAQPASKSSSTTSGFGPPHGTARPVTTTRPAVTTTAKSTTSEPQITPPPSSSPKVPYLLEER